LRALVLDRCFLEAITLKLRIDRKFSSASQFVSEPAHMLFRQPFKNTRLLGSANPPAQPSMPLAIIPTTDRSDPGSNQVCTPAEPAHDPQIAADLGAQNFPQRFAVFGAKTEEAKKSDHVGKIFKPDAAHLGPVRDRLGGGGNLLYPGDVIHGMA
jgi:hypothetical protein